VGLVPVTEDAATLYETCVRTGAAAHQPHAVDADAVT
jgi:hypothetical protein